MKKMTLLLVALVCIVAVPVFAGNNDLVGSITYKGDFVQSNTTSKTEHRVEVYARHKGLLGAGIDTAITPELAYSLFRPYATMTKGMLSATAGYSTDSNKKEHVFAGIWLTPSFGKVKVFLDMKNYFAINEVASSYQDNFLEVAYPATAKVTIAGNGIYCHYWSNDMDVVLVGPVAYYAITDQIKIFARYSHEWVIFPRETVSADRYRVGIKASF